MIVRGEGYLLAIRHVLSANQNFLIAHDY